MCFLIAVFCITDSATCSSEPIAIDFAMNFLSSLVECGDIPSIVYTMIWHENPSLLTQLEISDCGMTTADATDTLGSLKAGDSAIEEITCAALLDNDGSLDISALFDCTGRLNRVALLSTPVSMGNSDLWDNIGGYCFLAPVARDGTCGNLVPGNAGASVVGSTLCCLSDKATTGGITCAGLLGINGSLGNPAMLDCTGRLDRAALLSTLLSMGNADVCNYDTLGGCAMSSMARGGTCGGLVAGSVGSPLS